MITIATLDADYMICCHSDFLDEVELGSIMVHQLLKVVVAG
jgi:hypothetical protein